MHHVIRGILTLILTPLHSSTFSPKRQLREVVKNLKIMSLQEPYSKQKSAEVLFMISLIL